MSQDKHKFNADRATNGEPVQFFRKAMSDLGPGEWVDVHYVGPDRVRGGHVIQFKDGDILTTSALRMKPRIETMFVNFYSSGRAAWYLTKEAAAAEIAPRGWGTRFATAVKIEAEVDR